MTWILTYSGLHFDYADPQPDQIDIRDIACGLAAESRFAGQTIFPYSVAQHSVAVSGIVPATLRLEGLLHDATEAYMKDLPQPLKTMLPEYKAIERRVDAAIREKFGLPAVASPEVKHADLVMLATERRDLLPQDDTPWQLLEGITPLEERIKEMAFPDVLQQFLCHFDETARSERTAGSLERKAFEAWIALEFPKKLTQRLYTDKGYTGEYLNMVGRLLWKCWQARAAIAKRRLQ